MSSFADNIIRRQYSGPAGSGDFATIFIVEDVKVTAGFSGTMIALAAITMLCSPFWYIKYRQHLWTYVTVFLSATFCLIGDAIVVATLLKEDIASEINANVSKSMAASFFMLIFPVMVWIVAFVIFIELGKNENEASWKRYFAWKQFPGLFGLAMSILWIVLSIVAISILASVIYSTENATTFDEIIATEQSFLTTAQLILAVNYGLWIMVFFAGYHLILFHERLHFKKSKGKFGIFLVLLLVMTIGRTVLFASVTDSVSISTINSMRNGQIAEFVLSRLLAMVNLILVVIYRNDWVHEPENHEVVQDTA